MNWDYSPSFVCNELDRNIRGRKIKSGEWSTTKVGYFIDMKTIEEVLLKIKESQNKETK